MDVWVNKYVSIFKSLDTIFKIYYTKTRVNVYNFDTSMKEMNTV